MKHAMTGRLAYLVLDVGKSKVTQKGRLNCRWRSRKTSPWAHEPALPDRVARLQ
jgi:hypothetical protein